jgi:hypothetical protein
MIWINCTLCFKQSPGSKFFPKTKFQGMGMKLTTHLHKIPLKWCICVLWFYWFRDREVLNKGHSIKSTHGVRCNSFSNRVDSSTILYNQRSHLSAENPSCVAGVTPVLSFHLSYTCTWSLSDHCTNYGRLQVIILASLKKTIPFVYLVNDWWEQPSRNTYNIFHLNIDGRRLIASMKLYKSRMGAWHEF